ncbi:MAG TPA: PP2C family serine/threonine-protein phosphatase [Bryobacteraceae bacterium]|jgi:serine/threonine protein phosphatase PrpC|nr:PP2C family serine/threonine-protein phosphatase [Bryobacteraceae bacterium]
MLEAFGLSDSGCVRQNNEDFYLISPTGVYIVADGMGGAQAGEHASKLAVETVAAVIQKNPTPDAETLFQAFREANLKVMKEAASNPDLEGMGTTLVAALESGPELLIASVGDSRVYLYNGSELTGITEDQTWVNEVGRKLGIDETSLKTHPMRHVLTMAIGVSPELRVHSYTLRPHPGELIMISSDGLHGVLEPGVMAEKLAGNGSLQAKCERLIEAAKQAGGPDNITVVLLKAR